MNKAKIKDRILSENTAQGILKHLRDLESNRVRMQGRWIWELLQNARDASVDDDTRLVASITLKDGELVFQHNGRGFTEDEVAHLIFHGSTKLEDESTIGQYGSGFLTTHLLSPEIDVSGQLSDGTPFNFLLKREISSTKALSDSMDRAWDEFDASGKVMSGGFTTRFRYPIGEIATDAVRGGIKTLRRCAPYVVVFNRQFRRIDIDSPDGTTSFEVIERLPLDQKPLQLVTVGVRERDTRTEWGYLLAEGEQASVAIPLDASSNAPTCMPIDDTPRLFLGFPLIGTERFSFPAVVNSFNFTPTEDRDGVYLGQSGNTTNLTNQGVLEEACLLHLELIRFVTEAHWGSVHELAVIPPVDRQNWLNEDWLQEQLSKLVKQMRGVPAVLCGQEPAAPGDAALPVASNDENVETLWYLLNEVEDLREKLPRRSEAVGWCHAVQSWAAVENCKTTSFEEGFDGGKLASWVEEGNVLEGDWGTLDELQDCLLEETSAVEWLDRLYALLKDDGLDSLVRERRFIPDQAGYLDKLSNLHRDVGVDDLLKVIADDALGLDVRESLRDLRLSSLAEEIGKGDYGNDDIIQAITGTLKALCTTKALTRRFTQASPRMLSWFVDNGRWKDLLGFPAYSEGPTGGLEPLWLGQQGGEDADLPLAPIKAWPEDIQEFSDLFPWGHIAADAFFELMPDLDAWRTLGERGYVRTNVILDGSATLGDFLPDAPLPDGDHRTVEAVPITDVAFLTKDRVGIMARVRDSQERARLFWRFLTEWLVLRDTEGMDTKTSKCVCGEDHDYYQATWLLPLVNNRWVPQGNDIRDRASAKSLAKLLRDSDWTPSSLRETSPTVKLLEIMDVTRLDLMREFVVSDEEARANLDDAMTRILASTGGDLRYVSEFVEDMKNDKDLPEYLAERRKRRQTVHENHRLGELVENLVRDGLEGEGFTVKRTGIGSDFEIEYDLVEEGKEIGIELSRNGRSWLVEVKATRDQRVRMTAKQAETAADRGDGFLLCVVPVSNSQDDLEVTDIRSDIRFVQNIGPRVEPLCNNLEALNYLRDDAAAASSDGDIRLEIQAGTARVRVDNTVWEDGISLEDLSSQLK